MELLEYGLISRQLKLMLLLDIRWSKILKRICDNIRIFFEQNAKLPYLVSILPEKRDRKIDKFIIPSRFATSTKQIFEHSKIKCAGASGCRMAWWRRLIWNRDSLFFEAYPYMLSVSREPVLRSAFNRKNIRWSSTQMITRTVQQDTYHPFQQGRADLERGNMFYHWLASRHRSSSELRLGDGIVLMDCMVEVPRYFRT